MTDPSETLTPKRREVLRRQTTYRTALIGGDELAALLDALAAAEADRDRYRARIHEAVDECQRRHAPFVKRCERYDQTAQWYLSMLVAQGKDLKSWNWNSEAMRALAVKVVEERDEDRTALARVKAALRDARLCNDPDCGHAACVLHDNLTAALSQVTAEKESTDG